MSKYYIIKGDEIWYYGFKPKKVSKEEFWKNLKLDWQRAYKKGDEPPTLEQIKEDFNFDVLNVQTQELNNSFYIKTNGVKIEDYLEIC